FGLKDGVMNAMHVGRDHEPAQESLQPRKDKDIAMVEHGSGIEKNFKKEDAKRRRADRGNSGKFYYQGQEDFDGMEARAGGNVDIQIGVVHAMESPKDRLVMKRPVLKVNDQIEHEDGSGDGNPARYRRNVEQTPAMIPYPECKADCARWNEEPDHDAVNECNADIGRPAGTPLEGAGPSRKRALANRKNRKHSKITGDPDERFVFEQGGGHGYSVEKIDRKANRNDGWGFHGWPSLPYPFP